MNKKALFHFYGSLTDFLPKVKRGFTISYMFTGTPAVKDAIEAIGIPHTEVEAIRARTNWCVFHDKLQDADDIHVYPVDVNVSTPPDYTLRPTLPEPVCFLLDVHLGSLTRLLRLLGFDAIYDPTFTDTSIAFQAKEEYRIVLTRDIGLLKHRSITWGYWLRSQQTEEQVLEVIRRFQLQHKLLPFTRCLVCNSVIKSVSKGEVVTRVPENAIRYFDTFFECNQCKRIYWEGSHFDRMVQTIERIKQAVA